MKSDYQQDSVARTPCFESQLSPRVAEPQGLSHFLAFVSQIQRVVIRTDERSKKEIKNRRRRRQFYNKIPVNRVRLDNISVVVDFFQPKWPYRISDENDNRNKSNWPFVIKLRRTDGRLRRTTFDRKFSPSPTTTMLQDSSL